MDPAEYTKMYHQEESYWWFQGRKQIVAQTLSRLAGLASKGSARVADLGCGTGLMLAWLRENSHWGVGLDFSPLALDFSRRRGAERLLQADATRLPLRSGIFDIATALDLAEHVEDDALLFAEAFRILRPGGHLVLTVPAHPWLWSEHDDALRHFRRYIRPLLRRRLLAAGFRIERLTYCIALTFPLIVLFRLLQRLLPRPPRRARTHVLELPPLLNRLVLASVQLEGLWLRRANLPIGCTLLAVASKPE